MSASVKTRTKTVTMTVTMEVREDCFEPTEVEDDDPLPPWTKERLADYVSGAVQEYVGGTTHPDDPLRSGIESVEVANVVVTDTPAGWSPRSRPQED